MYKLHKSPTANEINAVQRLSDNAFIPMDPDNVDFQEYQRWLAEGNQPIPADEE